MTDRADNQGSGGALWGTFDEAAMEADFSDAVAEWRGEARGEGSGLGEQAPH